jgi:hypothetical protein
LGASCAAGCRKRRTCTERFSFGKRTGGFGFGFRSRN